MKIILTFKTPDVIDNAIQSLTKEETKIVKQVVAKFVEYEEYINIEFDTKAKTCTVLPV